MKRTQAIIAFVLAMLLFVSSGPRAAEAEAPLAYSLGDKIQDFTFTTYDGQNITLSEVLKEKEAVLINIWATWCGPCRNEFPFLEEAYKQYQDKVEVIALSCEPSDTDDVLASFAADMGLTFKIGRDPVNFLYALGIGSIPTSLMIDRFGTICFIESGSQPSVEAFTRLFDAFLGEDYTESVLFDGLPPMKANVEPSSEADIAAALNADGATITYSNDPGRYVWPMIVSEKDGRSVVASSNQGKGPSESRLHATVAAKAGDAITVTFKLSSEPIYDLMQLRINGELIKSFGGEKDWMTYAYPVPADGEYAVTITYTNDAYPTACEDTLWVDSLTVLSGDDAAAAVAANPVYPVSDKIALTVLNESAREIVFTDPTGIIAAYYGDGPFYLVPDEEVIFGFEMTAEYDPETALVGFNYDGRAYALTDCIVDGAYVASSGGDSMETTGYCDSTVYLYPDWAANQQVQTLTYFRSEENLNAFVADLTVNQAGVVLGTWEYADNAEAAESQTREKADKSTYTLKCVDQNGSPVAGVMLQVCDEETCQVLVSGADGMCEFTAAPYAWEVHILKAPEGYTADSADVQLAPVEGGELVFALTKN